MPRISYRKLFVLLCLMVTASASSALAQLAHGVTSTGNLVRFDVSEPGTMRSSKPITGLGAGERILGMTFAGPLYALGSASRLYLIDPASAVATQVGSDGAFTLIGSSFGFSFNPRNRSLEVASATQVLSIDPSSGALRSTSGPYIYGSSDVNAGQPANVVGWWHEHIPPGCSCVGAGAYGIDSDRDLMVHLWSGIASTMAPLGVDTSEVVAMDGSYAVLQVGGVSGLYSLFEAGNPAVHLIDNFPSGVTITAFAFSPAPPRLGNISTRGHVGTGDDVLIGGFVIGGPGHKTVMVRARGPSLATHGIQGVLANPVLQLFSGSTQVAASDNWQDAANASEIVSSGFAPANAQEAAILVTLAPGMYTAIVSGAGGTTGVAVVEVFELDALDVPLLNISTRLRTGTGEQVAIVGFIVQGGPMRVTLRARGPSLTAHGVANTLSNPLLQLFSGTTQIAANDNHSGFNQDPLEPGHPWESAFSITLQAGGYTAFMTGVGGETGVGIVEVFKSRFQF